MADLASFQDSVNNARQIINLDHVVRITVADDTPEDANFICSIKFLRAAWPGESPDKVTPEKVLMRWSFSAGKMGKTPGETRDIRDGVLKRLAVDGDRTFDLESILIQR